MRKRQIRSNRRKLPVLTRTHDHHRSHHHRRDLGQPEVADGQGDSDELGHDGQRIQDEQVDDAERSPELPEALQDETGVPDPGDSAEAQNHLLTDIEDRHQEEQRPEQMRSVVLAGLGVGAEGTGVVVADHDDQPGADDRKQGLGLGRKAWACSDVPAGDGAEGAADVADVLGVEDGDLVESGSRGHRRQPPIT